MILCGCAFRTILVSVGHGKTHISEQELMRLSEEERYLKSMFEVTEENYHTFLTSHGLDPECASWVVAKYDNTDNYHQLSSVRLWVEASKLVIRENMEC
jgi:hypothetical protein